MFPFRRNWYASLYFYFFLLAGTAFATDPPPLDSPILFSNNEVIRLQSGKSLLKEIADSPFQAYCDNPWIAAMLLPKDATEAAGLLMDFQRHPKIFPRVKDITVTPLGESRYRVGFKVQAGFFQFHYTTLWVYQPEDYLAAFRLDPEEKNDFEEYKGFWKFVPQKDGKTLALYSIRTKTVDNPLSFLEDQASRNEMTRTLEEFSRDLGTQY